MFSYLLELASVLMQIVLAVMRYWRDISGLDMFFGLSCIMRRTHRASPLIRPQGL